MNQTTTSVSPSKQHTNIWSSYMWTLKLWNNEKTNKDLTRDCYSQKTSHDYCELKTK